MKAITCRYVDIKCEFFLKKKLDPNQIESAETALRIIIDKQVQIARRPGFVAGHRTEKVKRSGSERADCVGLAFQLLDGLITLHGRYSTAFRYPPPRQFFSRNHPPVQCLVTKISNHTSH